MLKAHLVLAVSLTYMAILFVIAYFCEKKPDAGRRIINNPYIYSLSLAVYCTGWTFYGSVGHAARTGVGFLPIFIGPTLLMIAGWSVIRKIIRISRIHHITSIADFIASRYGKSSVLGGFVSIIAVVGVVPYISLQLKAIPMSYLLITSDSAMPVDFRFSSIPVLYDTAFYITIILILFSILFGTRSLIATERHEGLVATTAFSSVVKLIAFLAAGIFVTYGIYNGFGDILSKIKTQGQYTHLLTMNNHSVPYSDWTMYLIISMAAVLLLPRQFQMTVVENVSEKHIGRAMWVFPLYLLLINIFVIPIAMGGLLRFGGGAVDADSFVLSLAMIENNSLLTLFIFIGGLSAASGMVIVETIALSTMICNDLVMPVILRLPGTKLAEKKDISKIILYIRRFIIAGILLISYSYFRYIGEFSALISSGLKSFVAVAQFAPLMIGGIFWKSGTKKGALCGLTAGFCIWIYTLILPSFVNTGLITPLFIQNGPWGIALLKPWSLFGLSGFDPIAHAAFCSLAANILTYVVVSLVTRPTTIEQTQASLFVDVFKYSEENNGSVFWRGSADFPDLKSLLVRFLGKNRAEKALDAYFSKNETDLNKAPSADPKLVQYAEKLLSGAIGSSSANIMVSSVVKAEPIKTEDIMELLDETRQVMEYSRRLEKATAANVRLKELDRLKDEFISTVTHELRTPLTSIRSLSEIIFQTPDIDMATRHKFLETIINECNRLQRLIAQTLDFQKIESGAMDWIIAETDMIKVIRDSIDAVSPLLEEKPISLRTVLPEEQSLMVEGDGDMLIQVVINLLSNAIKFCDKKNAEITVTLKKEGTNIKVNIRDNGMGIPFDLTETIFERFRQVKGKNNDKPRGTGLGLTISRRIIEFHNGNMGVSSVQGVGSDFYFTLPVKQEPCQN